MTSDPPRLLDHPDLPHRQRQLLEQGHTSAGAHYDRQAGAARLRAAIVADAQTGAEQAAAPGVPHPTATGGLSMTAKLLLGGGAGAIIAATAVLTNLALSSHPAPSRPARRPDPAMTPMLPHRAPPTPAIARSAHPPDPAPPRGVDQTSALDTSPMTARRAAATSAVAKSPGPVGATEPTGTGRNPSRAVTAGRAPDGGPVTRRSPKTHSPFDHRPARRAAPFAGKASTDGLADRPASRVAARVDHGGRPPRPTRTSATPRAARNPQPSAPPTAKLAPAKTAPRPRPGAAAENSAIQPQPSTLLLELREVARAKRLLAQHPGRALQVLRKLDVHRPAGHLVEERLALTVMALALLDRRDDAARSGEQFLRRYPRSPYAARVRSTLQQYPRQ